MLLLSVSYTHLNANIHFTCDKSNLFLHLIDLQSALKRVSGLIPSSSLAIPELDILIHMAEIFETSIDYLVGNTDVPFKYETYDADTSFTRSEMRVLNYYRHLSSNAKDFVQEVIQKGYES